MYHKVPTWNIGVGIAKYLWIEYSLCSALDHDGIMIQLLSVKDWRHADQLLPLSLRSTLTLNATSSSTVW